MDTLLFSNGPVALQEEINRAFIGAMSRVYLWMTGGLVLTTIVAMVVALNPDIQAVVFSNGLIVFGLIGAQIGLVLLISATINKLSPAMALGLFFLFAGMMGVTLSVIFVGAAINFRTEESLYGTVPGDIDDERFIKTWVDGLVDFIERSSGTNVALEKVG